MNDLRFALRQLLKTPGFTAVAVLTLALGIGANTAIFSLLNAVWMRSLPVRDPHQLRVVNWSGHNVQLAHWTGGGGGRSQVGTEVHGSFPYPLYLDFERQVTGCSDVFAFFGLEGLTVGGSVEATTADALMVSGNFFEGYGAKALMGRTIVPSDESSQAGPVAVITYAFWEKVFGLDPQVLGQVISLNQHPFNIVGVLPKTFCGPEIGNFATLYVPMSAQPILSPGHPLEARNHWWARVMTRLEPGANETQVTSAMKGLLLQTLSAPEQQTRVEKPNIVLEDGSRGLLGVRRMMALGISLIMGAVGLVLVIACANLAGLLLARGSAREHELSVRAALGAGRARLIRQLLTESLVLSLAGAGLGCLLVVWVKSLVLGFIPDTLQGFQLQVGMGLNTFLFALGSALMTTLLCGLLPALKVTRVDLCSGLKSRQVSGVPSLRLGKALVVGQVSLSVLLIVASGLLLQTLINLNRVDLGFNPKQLLVFRVNPGQAGLEDIPRTQFYDQIQEAVEALPGVQSVAMSSDSLLGGRRSGATPSFPSRDKPQGHNPMADLLDVNEVFFQTLDIPLLRGRAFHRADAASDSRAVVVNKVFVDTFFENEDPIGQSFLLGKETDCLIVGVCGDAKYDRPQRSIEPTIYRFHRQASLGAMSFEVRTAVEPLSLVPGIREIVADLNRAVPLEKVSTQSQMLEASITPERLLSALGSGLALLGIVLSGMGLYGLLAFMVTRRTGEIGLRLALGARRRDIARQVISNALRLAAIGLLIGIPAALGLTQALRSVLFGVRPHDPITLVASTLLVASLAALAAWIPARRASCVDPMVALRSE
jgi:predicted permease